MQLVGAVAHHRAGTLRLVVVSSVAGALTGLVSETFGLLVRDMGRLRGDFIRWAQGASPGAVVLVVGAAAVAATAAVWLVHRVEPHAEGSGIPRVEAVVEGRAEPGRLRILPVKYVGGLLAIGGGLALGREGPLVQMGGVIGSQCARMTRLAAQDMRMIVAGGAAAGLATAFNAPIAGGVFVLEELFRRFDPRATVSTLSASAAGFAATHLLVGDHTDFTMLHLPAPALRQAPICLVVGVLCGLLGVAYNKAILAGLRWGDRSSVPVVARAVGIGATAGVIGWFAPSWVGTGDNLTQAALSGGGALGAVVLVFVVRFGLGVVSYAANAPGGLFAPMLVLGSHAGLGVGLALAQFVHVAPGTTAALALVGLASFFTASVQAPVTGIILASEMTGSVTWLPPMLGTVAVAMLIAMLLGSESIYDALTTRAARNAEKNREEEAAEDRVVVRPAGQARERAGMPERSRRPRCGVPELAGPAHCLDPVGKERGMNTDPLLFGHGSIAMPRMVGSLQRAKQLAAQDAQRSGQPEPVLAVDLDHPELAVEVLGYMHPDGSYRQASDL